MNHANQARHRVRIGEREVGPGCGTLVIAEIGVNHDGNVARAMQLVRAAAEAGADAVKLQLFTADRLVDADAGCCTYQNTPGTQADLLRRFELTAHEVEQVVEAIRWTGMLPLATPFGVEDVETVAALGLPAVKIASPDLVNRPLLHAAAGLGVPLLISTGASDEAEILEAETWLEHQGAPHAFLHCVSSYPAAMEEARLDWIGRLASLSSWPVGFSDHTTAPLAGALAVTAGACIIEKHLTYDRNAIGPDHAASCEPHELQYYIRQLRLAERMVGTGPRAVLPCEAEVRRLSRQRLVWRQNLPAGHVVTWDDLATRRPGESGISPAAAQTLIGRPLTQGVAAGQELARQHVAPGGQNEAVAA